LRKSCGNPRSDFHRSDQFHSYSYALHLESYCLLDLNCNIQTEQSMVFPQFFLSFLRVFVEKSVEIRAG
jgi:hypothetical protein